MAILNRFKPAINFILLIVPRRYFCCGSICFMFWCYIFLCCKNLMHVFTIISEVRETEWPALGK